MAKRRGTSLADIAKVTGVTTATVSRVLNNHYEGFSVRPELKQRILKAAQDLSYRPDLMAQSLRKSDTHIVGLLGTYLKLDVPEHTLRVMIDCGATAILAHHHYSAVYILQACSQLGIDVPGRVSVACFNDEYPLQFLHPTVTAIALPAEEAGRTAADLLIREMRGEKNERPVVMLKQKLMIRESTAPPPKSI